GALGLHRLELAIRPENVASLAVAEKLSMREEGLRPAFLHINGDWRDHRIFALTAEDLAEDGRGATFRERLDRSWAARAGRCGAGRGEDRSVGTTRWQGDRSVTGVSPVTSA